MKYETPITDADLHAWLDGQLSEARRRQVEAWLKHHPDKLSEVNEYRIIGGELHDLLDPIIKEPVPDALRVAPRRRFIRRVAVAAGFLCVGALAGWQANTLLADSPGRQIQQHLIRPASFAHYVYAAEQKHPVEVGAEHEGHLINWLSRRLHTPIKAPNLLQHGYALVGGRLLPSTDRMAAQFMYQAKTGSRVTLYVRRINNIKASPMFRFTHSGRINTFYWIEGELGYALSGELAREELTSLANATYQQLHPDI